jgi:hypothetical protein
MNIGVPDLKVSLRKKLSSVFFILKLIVNSADAGKCRSEYIITLYSFFHFILGGPLQIKASIRNIIVNGLIAVCRNTIFSFRKHMTDVALGC